jgi:predicted DNA-binding protein (UPF0251 family)/uncharacterized protein (UPF0297 family)
MKSIKTTGNICLKDQFDFEYKIAKIEYTEYEDESFNYVFTPNYSVIDLLSTDLFQGIPGLDLSLRKERYVRENIIPVFISERSPGKNREDLWQLLEACDMDYLNQLEWMIRAGYRYSGDPLYVRRYETTDEKQIISLQDVSSLDTRSVRIIRKLLVHICSGNDIQTDDFTIDDNTRKQYYSLLMSLYKKEKRYLDSQKIAGIKKSAADGKYKGRKRISIDYPKLHEVLSAYDSKKIDEADAIKRLGISKSTFYRRLKEYKSK